MKSENDTTMNDFELDTQKNRYLTFTLDKESFGIEIAHVLEIIGIQPITPVPDFPEYIKGVVNLRGKIIPIVDVRMRLKKQTAECTSRTCIIIVDIDNASTGMIVDTVSEVVDISEEDISLPANIDSGNCIKGIGKVGNEVKLLLNCDYLLCFKESRMVINL